MKYNISKDFNRCKIMRMPFFSLILYISRIPQDIMFKLTKISKDIKLKKYTLDNKLNVYIFEPKNNKGDIPCLFYFHGGAFGYKAASHHKKLACIYAKEVGIKVVLVDYSLLPRNTYPKALEDVLYTYKWIYKKHKELQIDKNRIAVGGDSAGAVLATYLCNGKEVDKLCAQMLVYPVTDANMETESMKKYDDTPMWNSKNNKRMWSMYLKNTNIIQRKEASPMQASLSNDIPNTYIEVAEFDCLHDEGINYFKRLLDRGVKVELNETYGTVHGYDMVLNSKITKESVSKRIKFLKENMF